MEDEKGYVYILTNPAFQEDWVKIGMTKDVDKRVKDLSNKTCLPYAFDVYAWCKTILYKEMEKQMHELVGNFIAQKVTPNKEFFQIPPSKALEILKTLAKSDKDAEFYVKDEILQQHKQQSAPFRFSMVDIKPGAKLIFEPSKIEVVVTDHKQNNRIEYNDKSYTLSGFCKEFMPEIKRNKSNAYQGPAYFSYNGCLLVRLREQMENKEN